jgi:hypothetical protein
MSRKKERGEREKKMPFIVATYVYASSQGQRTHSARTNKLAIDGVSLFSTRFQDLLLVLFKILFKNLIGSDFAVFNFCDNRVLDLLILLSNFTQFQNVKI